MPYNLGLLQTSFFFVQINYSALVDVRNIMQHDPEAMVTVNDGGNQTPPSKDAAENLVSNTDDDNEINVPKDNDQDMEEGEVDPWERFSSKKIEMAEPDHTELNLCSSGEAGPSTSTGPDANRAESSGVKEGQTGDSSDPWLTANKPDPFQENNAGWSDIKKTGPAENDCENGSSWGRPWSAFVVSRASSVVQPDKENDWRAGSSHGSGKPWSRGAPRGRGRGRGYNRGRGRNG